MISESVWSAQACLRVGLTECARVHAGSALGQQAAQRQSGSKLPHSKGRKVKHAQRVMKKETVLNIAVGHSLRTKGIMWSAQARLRCGSKLPHSKKG